MGLVDKKEYEFTGLVPRGNKGINERYRPYTFHEVIGNESTKEALAGWMAQGEKRTKALLFIGPSGCCKTTFAQILAMGLNCENGDTVNPCCECPSCQAAMVNMAQHIRKCNMSAQSTKEDADEIIKSMDESGFTGRNNVFILDEIQSMSVGSQNLALMKLEDPPPHTYIFMCTTDPQKILGTIQSRCETYEVEVPDDTERALLMKNVVQNEYPDMPPEKRKIIFDACKGMGYRKILMELSKFMNGGKTTSYTEDAEVDVQEIARLLVKGECRMILEKISKAGKNFTKAMAENVRMAARVWLSNEMEFSLKKGDASKAARMFRAFRVFDRGFYADANPLPSMKADIFEACMIIKGTGSISA